MHCRVAGSIAQPAGVTSLAPPVAPRETIAAISTPVGEGAIAVVRISGENAVALADQIYRGAEKPSAFPAQTQRLGEIVEDDQLIDQVMLTVHRAPASYTGEDLVEISCHGGVLVTARVLETCLKAGARAARPGEFTERAFLNGKMDMTQAEAVMDLIRAQSDLALRSATEQLEGRLGAEIEALRAQLIEMLAHVEASIDFPDEDIAPDQDAKLSARLEAVRQRMRDLLATAGRGRILREGIRAVIYGPTNAGKSSLLNRLLGYDRAIVSEKPGTTRDTIEEVINLRGIPIRLLDTAGLRDSDDELERAGMDRTEKSLSSADLLLQVLDHNAPKPPAFDESATDQIRIVLLNKSDLPEHPDWTGHDALRISCLEENGLHGLEGAIFEEIAQRHLRPESAVAINARHRDCLARALASCDLAAGTMEAGLAPEYMAVDLRASLRAVGEITGADNVEEILNSVFAQFCIGK
ncbi:MAG: tRNA uridine-5-carboxymethylaminomethyl(34) synthesis GTPase MnmE [Chthoniobacterales bacterium]|nr:MAG: tRNA uridine-5-carboxymethylaminomethyl(34) synthesis GTPase MnmE [Chthoniobacterales bacterium]